MMHQATLEQIRSMRFCLFLHGEAGLRAVSLMVESLKCSKDALAIVTYNDPENLPIRRVAEKNGIAVLTDDVRSSPVIERLRSFRPDLLISIHYRHLIPVALLNSASVGGINLHPSLLPKYRGAFSAPWVIINNEAATGITYHFMNEKFDDGPIILQEMIPLTGKESAGELFFRLIELGISRLGDAIVLAAKGSISAHAQRGQASYYPRRIPHDGIIDPSWSLTKVDRFIRAMTFPGKPPARLQCGGRLINVTSMREYLLTREHSADAKLFGFVSSKCGSYSTKKSAVKGQLREAVIFDLDGVLWDSLQAWELARGKVTKRLGGEFSHNLELQMRPMAASEWPKFLISTTKLKIAEPLLYQLVTEELIEQLKGISIPEGSSTALACLSEQFLMGIASSAPVSAIEYYLQICQVGQCFAATVSGDQVSMGKPSPDVYLRCADLLGVRPGACAGVDDSSNGLRAVARAGMAVIAVGSDARPNDVQVNIDASVKSVLEVDEDLIRKAMRFSSARHPPRAGELDAALIESISRPLSQVC